MRQSCRVGCGFHCVGNPGSGETGLGVRYQVACVEPARAAVDAVRDDNRVAEVITLLVTEHARDLLSGAQDRSVSDEVLVLFAHRILPRWCPSTSSRLNSMLCPKRFALSVPS